MNLFSANRSLSLALLICSSYAFAMQQGSSAQIQSLVQSVKTSITTGNSTLQSIINSGSVTTDHTSQLNQVTTNITAGVNGLDALITDIKATIAKNEKDPKVERAIEDIGGCLLDVLEDTGPLVFTIFQEIAAEHQDHPVMQYHNAIQTLKTKISQKK